MTRDFELYLFSADPATVRRAVAAGVAGVVVDWERIGKRHRQAGADTQIGEDTVDDLRRVRAGTSARVLCRVDNDADLLEEQVETAIALGADEILLPMARSADELERMLDSVAGRCGLGILVETVAILEELEEVAQLPLSRVYVGLNDLAIERGDLNIFSAVVDGVVEWIRGHFDVPFGLAGLTVVDGGVPIPCRLLVGEIVRLGCAFSFLRRSYHADIRGRDPAVELARLQDEIRRARRRPAALVDDDRAALIDAVEAWEGALASP
jgi:2-keto-3-deoxy-L-rhamnonate aldolase RhmA